MKRALILSLGVVLASCLSVSAAASARALRYKSPDGSFKMKVPARPRIQSKTLNIGSMRAPMKMYLGQLDDKITYTVAHIDFPREGNLFRFLVSALA